MTLFSIVTTVKRLKLDMRKSFIFQARNGLDEWRCATTHSTSSSSQTDLKSIWWQRRICSGAARFGAEAAMTLHTKPKAEV
jgi:hypothetical protein